MNPGLAVRVDPHRCPAEPTRGSVSIEAVILIPLFLVAIFAILQASLWVYASTVAQAAAADGARAGTLAGAGPDDGPRLAESILTARDVGAQWVVDTQSDNDTLTITVSGYAMSVVPGVNIPVHESASLPWEEQ